MKIRVFSICCAIALAIFLATAAGSAAAGSTAAGRIPIRWFVGLGTGTNPEQIAVQQQVVADFNAAQSEIELTLEVFDYPASIGVLQGYIANGNAPDIVGPVGVSGSNAFKGLWLDLSQLISSAGYDLSDLDPSLVDFFYSEADGQISLPFVVYPSFLYYNKDLFDQAGLAYPPHEYGQPYTDTTYGGTWDVAKLTEIARRLTLDGAARTAVDLGFDPNDIQQFGYLQQWTDARGEATFFGADSFADLNGDAQIPDAWRAAYHWYYAGMWGSQPFIPNNAYALTDTFGASNVFSSGRAAIAHSHSWYTCCFGEPEVANWDIAAVPAYSATVTAKLHADSFYILNSSSHPAEAFTVLEYLFGTAAQDLIEAYGGFPARTSLQADALASFATRFPGVDWQVLIDSIAYADLPNHESYLPNYLNAYDRIAGFYNAYHDQAGLDIDVELASLQTDLQAIFDGGTETTVQTDTETSLVYYDDEGINTVIQIPAGAVGEETQLQFEPVLALPMVEAQAFAGMAFELTAYQSGLPVPGLTFANPLTVTVFYEPSDVAGLFEPGLGLYRWDGDSWESTGISVVSRDAVHQRLTVQIEQVGLYALFGSPGYKVALPLNVR